MLGRSYAQLPAGSQPSSPAPNRSRQPTWESRPTDAGSRTTTRGCRKQSLPFISGISLGESFVTASFSIPKQWMPCSPREHIFTLLRIWAIFTCCFPSGALWSYSWTWLQSQEGFCHLYVPPTQKPPKQFPHSLLGRRCCVWEPCGAHLPADLLIRNSHTCCNPYLFVMLMHNASLSRVIFPSRRDRLTVLVSFFIWLFFTLGWSLDFKLKTWPSSVSAFRPYTQKAYRKKLLFPLCLHPLLYSTVCHILLRCRSHVSDPLLLHILIPKPLRLRDHLISRCTQLWKQS